MSKKEAEEAKAIAAAKEEELSRFKAKTYDEVPKDDNVYICKEASELNTDRHKIGKAIDTKRRESQLNTGSAQGSKIIYERPTLNAKLIEDIANVALKRYHCNREHYNSRVEHSVDILDIATTVVDTLASSYEHISRESLFDLLIAKLQTVRTEFDDANNGEEDPIDKMEQDDVPVDIKSKLTKDDEKQTTLNKWLNTHVQFTGLPEDFVVLGHLHALYNERQNISAKEFLSLGKAYFSAIENVTVTDKTCVKVAGSFKTCRNVMRGALFVPVQDVQVSIT
ncbi:hypothetical protein TSOC_014773 [Tetrabaena socialis]|uniref:Uncharacterized protein n=1 Tax=Tetrabaena socialis TaxID=47790 RepID=A0A2J7ZGT7_9CHLO|nr:hypothetical protein TSOC_014773 [Tetrabaena socialis]|eukprot:PNG99449.1 hypothetical protein TSOC_014773 [Tetrabaena socialis]